MRIGSEQQTESTGKCKGRLEPRDGCSSAVFQKTAAPHHQRGVLPFLLSCLSRAEHLLYFGSVNGLNFSELVNGSHKRSLESTIFHLPWEALLRVLCFNPINSSASAVGWGKNWKKVKLMGWDRQFHCSVWWSVVWDIPLANLSQLSGAVSSQNSPGRAAWEAKSPRLCPRH